MNIGYPLNDKCPHGISSISPNGNMLLVLNAYENGAVGDGFPLYIKRGYLGNAKKNYY